MYYELESTLRARIESVEGVRPTVAAIPSPGVYWLKTVSCGSYWIDRNGTRLDRPSHNEIWSIYTWELMTESEWFLGKVESNGTIEVISGDESMPWESHYGFVVKVGPRIEPPTEE